jgi:hypothetical protein
MGDGPAVEGDPAGGVAGIDVSGQRGRAWAEGRASHGRFMCETGGRDRDRMASDYRALNGART